MTADAPPFSAHARYAQHTAAKLGYAFTSLDGADGYLFEIADGVRKAVFSTGAGTPYALNLAHAAAIARDKAFCQVVLERAGLATIPTRLFFVTEEHAAVRGPGREPADAHAFAAAAAYPIFCKPVSGSQGAFAEIIADAGQFERYVARVRDKHYAILVQPFIEAREHRVIVLNGKALCAYEKTRPALVGDGVSSLGRLAQTDAETVRARDEAGVLYRAGDAPPRGALVHLDGPANRAMGGAAVAVMTDVAPALAEVALRAAACIDLNLAAVDLFVREDTPLIIEVNSSPAIKTLEDHGRWDLIETIWAANIAAALR